MQTIAATWLKVPTFHPALHTSIVAALHMHILDQKLSKALNISSSWVAVGPNLKEAYKSALAGDPVSAFGGVLISNSVIDKPTAELINSLFCEVLIAPSFDTAGLEILKQKHPQMKNLRISKTVSTPKTV